MAHQLPDMHEQTSSSAGGNGGSHTTTATTHGSTMLQQQQQQFAQEFWEEQIVAAEQFDSDFKSHPLPLARIKKVMKSDPEVKMISAEAPILFSKACEIFICEMTRRAWLHAEENKRRTLQRSDVANAVSRSDQFDFLIDIVPREEAAPKPAAAKRSATSTTTNATAATQEGTVMSAEEFEQRAYHQYYAHSAGGLAGYTHAMEAPAAFYQSMTPQFQPYMQYQPPHVVSATPSYQTEQQQPQAAPSSRGESIVYKTEDHIKKIEDLL